MKISTRAKALVGAVAIGGAAIAMGGAFTAGGLSTSEAVSDTQFVGGSVEQSITGAQITAIVYEVNEASNKIDTVELTFGGTTADNKVPVIAFTGAEVNGAYTCAAVDATTKKSLCSPDGTTPVKADTNVTKLGITVAT